MIRGATIDDIPTMVAKAARHLETCSYSPLSYDMDKAAEFIEDLILTNRYVAVVERNGEIVGAMLGDIIQPWFTNDLIGIEYIIYIEPGHRVGKDAYQLIGRWINWCKENGVKQIRPQISSGNLGAARLYEAMGFQYVGPCFSMNV